VGATAVLWRPVLTESSVMRQTTFMCNRCGNAILENRSSIEIKAGGLGSRHDEPLDLCGDCQARFDDWLRSGRQNAGGGTQQ
jgi:hypothetical protein